MIALSFETRQRIHVPSASDGSTIPVEVECPHSSRYRLANCHHGHHVARVPVPSTPVDSWNAADLRAFLFAVINVADSGYSSPGDPIGFTWEQESRADHRGSRSRRVNRSMTLSMGGHRVTMTLPGFPHRALAALLEQNSDGALSIACSLRPDRLREVI